MSELRLPCPVPNCRLWDGHPLPHKSDWHEGVSLDFVTPPTGDDECDVCGGRHADDDTDECARIRTEPCLTGPTEGDDDGNG